MHIDIGPYKHVTCSGRNGLASRNLHPGSTRVILGRLPAGRLPGGISGVATPSSPLVARTELHCFAGLGGLKEMPQHPRLRCYLVRFSSIGADIPAGGSRSYHALSLIWVGIHRSCHGIVQIWLYSALRADISCSQNELSCSLVNDGFTNSMPNMKQAKIL